jgi:uncharacterized repeat protein (TIGR02543 family)
MCYAVAVIMLLTTVFTLQFVTGTAEGAYAEETSDTTPPSLTVGYSGGGYETIAFNEDVTLYYAYSAIGSDPPTITEQSPFISLSANERTRFPQATDDIPSNGEDVNLYFLAVDAAGNQLDGNRRINITDTTPPRRTGSGSSSAPSGSGRGVKYNEDVTLYYEYATGSEVPTVTQSSPSIILAAVDWAYFPLDADQSPLLWNGSDLNIYLLAVDAAGNSSIVEMRTATIPTQFNSSPVMSLAGNGYEPVHVGTKARVYLNLSLPVEYFKTWGSADLYRQYAVVEPGAPEPQSDDYSELDMIYERDFTNGQKIVTSNIDIGDSDAHDVYIRHYTPWGKASDIVKAEVAAATAPLDKQWVFSDTKTNSVEWWGVVGDGLDCGAYESEFLDFRATYRGSGISGFSSSIFTSAYVSTGGGAGVVLKSAGTGSLSHHLLKDEFFSEARLTWNVRSFADLDAAKGYKKAQLDGLADAIDLDGFPSETQDDFADAIDNMKSDIDLLETAEDIRKYDLDLSEWAGLELPVYQIVFYDADGGQIGPAQSIEYGKSATPPEAPDREGYFFIGWDHPLDFISESMYVTAQYEEACGVIFHIDETESVTVAVKNGERVEKLDDPEKEGHIFDGWFSDEACTTEWNFDTDVVTADTDLYAKWDRKSYTVTFQDHDGVVISTQSALYGDAVEAADPAREGYDFIGWGADLSNITSDLTVTAQYEPTVYTVTFEDWDGTPLDTQSVTHGAMAAAPTPPTRLGYDFTGWSADINNITSNLTITAQYAKSNVIIIDQPGDYTFSGGEITGDLYITSNDVHIDNLVLHGNLYAKGTNIYIWGLYVDGNVELDSAGSVTIWGGFSTSGYNNYGGYEGDVSFENETSTVTGWSDNLNTIRGDVTIKGSIVYLGDFGRSMNVDGDVDIYAQWSSLTYVTVKGQTRVNGQVANGNAYFNGGSYPYMGIYGGGSNSIHLKGVSVGYIEINKVLAGPTDEPVRVVFEYGAEVTSVAVDSSGSKIEIPAGVSIEELVVAATASNTTLSGSGTIKNLIIDNSVVGSMVNSGVNVEKTSVVNVPKTTVTFPYIVNPVVAQIMTAVKSAAKPAAPKKLAAPTAKVGKKQIKITWKKSATKGISGYEVQYRVVGKKWATKKIGAKATSLTIKKLKPGKRYEVRVRAIKKSGGKTAYGAWSKTMKSGKVKR